MGIKVQVSACPLALAHLSVLVTHLLLDAHPGSLHLQHSWFLSSCRWAGCQYHSLLFPRFSHLNLSQSSTRIHVILCLRREPFCWVAFTGSFHLIPLEPIVIWGGEIAVPDFEGPLCPFWMKSEGLQGSISEAGLSWDYFSRGNRTKSCI